MREGPMRVWVWCGGPRALDGRLLDGLACAACSLLTVAYEDVYDKLRTAMWPPPRCACGLAALAWRAVPLR